MLIERIDPAGDDLVRAYHIVRACHDAAAPADPMATEAEWLGTMRQPPSFLRRRHWLAGDVGYAELILFDDSATAYVEICVAPGARRHGLGQALLDTVTAQARAAACPTAMGRHADADGARFADRLGARTGNRLRGALLTMPPRVLPRAVDGYRVRSWTGPAPDDLLASYADARNAINDAPDDVDAPDERWTPERVREAERSMAARGRQIRVTVALDSLDGVAAYTELRVSPDSGAVARTEDTAVVAAHRRRGLASWVKAESLRLLATDRPDVTRVTTTNDATNVPMIAVNTAQGFAETVVWTHVFLPLR